MHEAGCTTKITTIDARAVEDLPRISTASVFVYKVHFWELSYYSACTRQGAIRVVIVELVSSFPDGGDAGNISDSARNAIHPLII